MYVRTYVGEAIPAPQLTRALARFYMTFRDHDILTLPPALSLLQYPDAYTASITTPMQRCQLIDSTNGPGDGSYQGFSTVCKSRSGTSFWGYSAHRLS